MMNRFMKCFLVVLSCLGLVSAAAFAVGSEGGGGGGAFVCRDPNTHKVIEAELLDLFEAREVNGATIAYDSNSEVSDQVLRALDRFRTVYPALADSFLKEWSFVKDHQVLGSANLVINPPNDADPHFQKPGCPLEGMMYFEDMRQRLVIAPEIFHAQKTKTDVAAAYVHETIYKVLREKFKATTSVVARHLTGCAFATNFSNCLNLLPNQVPEGVPSWSCSDGDNSILVSYLGQAGTYEYLYKIFFTKVGGSDFGFETSVMANTSERQIDPMREGVHLYFQDANVRIAGLEGVLVKLRAQGGQLFSFGGPTDVVTLGKYCSPLGRK